ncbi:MAG: nodulation protein NfeD [Candidatus Latescibacterota bacterium]|nr:MAG: nodulation protein NfeD [Candidatus Latescibacterota bacterium]RKY74256.1 MAG: nodulation protein NfeD [Candidatus Latescibacterota bacterium]
MNRHKLGLIPATLGLLFGLSLAAGAQPLVEVIRIDGIINPISSKFIVESIQRAEEDKAECLVIQMDTPGGLMESMRSVVKEMLSAEVPVVVYVWPSGARAASAGVFITLAAHIAAMTPGTNIGAAHPVSLGSAQDSTGAKTMMDKLTNDAAASIRSIANKRGRNAQWAEKAVRESVSITAREALKLGVIDIVCEDLSELLRTINGRKVKLPSGQRILHTENARIERIQMNFRYRILDKISNPNIAYILLMLGIYGIFFELANPGSILPGVAGAIFLILAFFALQTLPINYAGLLLILLAIVLFILETQIPSHGILTIGGIISMGLGSIMLINVQASFLRISWGVIIPAVIATAAFFLFAVGMGLHIQRRKPTTGAEGLVGEIGVALTRIGPTGKVAIHGEIWEAVSDQKIRKGEKILVIGVNRLRLRVSRSNLGDRE